MAKRIKWISWWCLAKSAGRVRCSPHMCTCVVNSKDLGEMKAVLCHTSVVGVEGAL